MKSFGTKTGLLLWVLIAAVALSACTSSGDKDKKNLQMSRDDKGSLKVAYFNEQAFYMQYGNAFQAMFPNVQLEVVSTEALFDAADPVAEMEKLVQEQKPDVLYLTEDQYAALAKSGKLYDLDAVVKQSQFDLDAFVPSVISLLKARGGGKLFGLSPSFSSKALYYNKDLFDKYSIPYPKDGMSWEELLQLAARFPANKEGNDALSGLTPSIQTTSSFELIRLIGEAKGLSYADADAGKVAIDTPEWKAIFQSVLDGYKSGGIALPKKSDGPGGAMMRTSGGGKVAFAFGPDSMNFMTGQSAMMIEGPMIMNMLSMNAQGGMAVQKSDSGKSSGNGMKSPFKQFNWDLATLPVDPSLPDVSGTMSLDNIFSINAASDNVAAAWEFLKYANGEQLAKTNAKSSPNLSARSAHKKEVEGKNVNAFYALAANESSLLQSLPDGFAASFDEMASEQIKKAADGAQSLEDTLAAIQRYGQDLLTKANLEAGNG